MLKDRLFKKYLESMNSHFSFPFFLEVDFIKNINILLYEARINC